MNDWALATTPVEDGGTAEGAVTTAPPRKLFARLNKNQEEFEVNPNMFGCKKDGEGATREKPESGRKMMQHCKDLVKEAFDQCGSQKHLACIIQKTFQQHKKHQPTGLALGLFWSDNQSRQAADETAGNMSEWLEMTRGLQSNDALASKKKKLLQLHHKNYALRLRRRPTDKE